jgi:hypothetical protein
MKRRQHRDPLDAARDRLRILGLRYTRHGVRIREIVWSLGLLRGAS